MEENGLVFEDTGLIKEEKRDYNHHIYVIMLLPNYNRALQTANLLKYPYILLLLTNVFHKLYNNVPHICDSLGRTNIYSRRHSSHMIIYIKIWATMQHLEMKIEIKQLHNRACVGMNCVNQLVDKW